MKQSKIKFAITIDPDIFEAIEKKRQKVRQSRSQFIKECVLKAIKKDIK